MIDNRTAQPHGGDIYRNKIHTDFSVNTNPLGPQPEVIEAIKEASSYISCYPDIYCEQLTGAIGRLEEISCDKILCGNGAAELFFAAVLALKPIKVLIPSPTFSEYERSAKVTGASVDFYTLKEENEFQIEEGILDILTPEFDLCFLCNPNNPTGQVIEKGLLDRIVKRCEEYGIFLILDECFVDFPAHSKHEYRRGSRGLCLLLLFLQLQHFFLCTMKKEIADYQNLVIIKAFTKMFCMPGLRLGYAISSNRRFLDEMKKCMQPWNVSVLAQAGGMAALENCEKYVEETKKLIKSERSFLKTELSRLGYRIYGSNANYIFFHAQEKDLYEKALADGFLIRDCSNYRGLEKGYYRIAVRTREENERMIKWLEKL